MLLRSPIASDSMPELSRIVLPVHLSRQALVGAVEEFTPKILVEEPDLLGRGLALRVRRRGSLGLEFVANGSPASGAVTLHVSLGADVTLTKASRLFGESSSRGSIELELAVAIGLSGWDLITHTEVVGHSWPDPPALRIAGLQLGLRGLLDAIVVLLRERVARRIDADLRRRHPLRTAVDKLVQQVRHPLTLDPERGVAARVALTSIGLGGLRAVEAGLQFTVAVEARLVLWAGTGVSEASEGEPAMGPLDNSGVSGLQPRFELLPELHVGYGLIEREARPGIVGQAFVKLGQELRVHDLRIAAGPAGTIAAEVDLRGATEATVRLTTRPAAGPDAVSVALSHTSVELPAGRGVLRVLLGLVKERIARVIEERTRVGSAAQIAAVREIVQRKLAGEELIPGVIATGDLRDLRLQRLGASSESVLAEARVEGEARLRVDRLPRQPGGAA